MKTIKTSSFSEREQIILNATLELVAEEGLLKTSISKISKRAKSSPGIVYHYFASKNEIMDTLFVTVTQEMMDFIMDEEILGLPILERYKGLWRRKYKWHFDNADKTIFIEQYKNSSFYTSQQNAINDRLRASLGIMGQKDIELGFVVNLPLEVIYAMTFTVALQLAKTHNASKTTLDDHILDLIADRVCSSVLS